MEHKKNSPAVRFRGFNEEWEEKELSELIDLENGYAFKSIYFQKERSNHIVLTPGNVNLGGGFQYGKGNYYNVLGDYPEKFNLKSGDIFITMTDLTPTGQTLGLPAIVPNDENIYLHNQRLAKLTKIEGNKNFLFQFLCINKNQKKIVLTSSGTTVKHTSVKKILECVNYFPSKPEQTKIGSFFENLDQLLTKHQTQHQKLQALKKAMLGKLFPKKGATTPEIRFKGFTQDWEVKTLGEVGSTYTGLSGKTKEDFGHGKGRFVTYMNVFTNAISDKNLIEPIKIDNSQNEVLKGDVFFTTSSETAEEVGMSSVWMEEKSNVYLNSFCFGYRPKIEFDNYYLANILRSNVFRKKISFLAQGISRYNISKNKVMELEIQIPSSEEQQQIGNYFKNLDELISKHATQIEKLGAIKKACLSKMFV
ncbi:restriction endonuclease subunit S [Tenacibaculum dicentrarchi]|nr:restriction endonuclease subunit S [Tenacibaculum dicentrarchi]MCD8423735.1 restriction endonuclease subunit S [Tenacibaculum dicentrarchi]MCD8434574.1 restriction endonuclease subunit S [Tenacibaculum dicentrarchi]